jgi:hypothetical protein
MRFEHSDQKARFISKRSANKLTGRKNDRIYSNKITTDIRVTLRQDPHDKPIPKQIKTPPRLLCGGV